MTDRSSQKTFEVSAVDILIILRISRPDEGVDSDDKCNAYSSVTGSKEL